MTPQTIAYLALGLIALVIAGVLIGMTIYVVRRTPAERLIPAITGLIVLFVFLCGFILSYGSLQRMAGDAGVGIVLSWLWPFMLDAVMVAASLSVFLNTLRKEAVWYPWVLVVGFTVISIAFNVLHVMGWLLTPDQLAPAVFAIPPLAAALTFHLLMQQVGSTVTRRIAVQSLSDIEEKYQRILKDVHETEAEIGGLEKARAEIARLQVQVTATENLHKRVAELEGRLRDGDAQVAQDGGDGNGIGVYYRWGTGGRAASLAKLTEFLLANPQADQKLAAQAFATSETTISRAVVELGQSVGLRKNGNGWVIKQSDEQPAAHMLPIAE